MTALREVGIYSTAGTVTFVTMVYRFAPERLAHVQRVAVLAVAMATSLGLSEQETDQIERAALLHDIGRLILPDPADASGAATERDYIRAVRQTMAASSALSSLPYLRPAAAIVAAMRECPDGTGMPHALSGNAIPVGAKILGVAKEFDELTNGSRDHAWSAETAVVELLRQVGARFDPDVVAAVLRVIDAGAQDADEWPLAARPVA